ncbi:MAG: thymidylate kinase [Longimicrobiales bacterium]
MIRKRCFGPPPPELDLASLKGLLLVLEGPDSSGRSSQIDLLAQWLEQQGFPVVVVGLKRSALVGKELEKAKDGNVLSPRTMSLFYATDFYDQLENTIVPALRAGAVVLADRYIFTPIARDIVRGADPDWLDSLYSGAIVPDAVFYLQVSTRMLVDRTLTSHGGLDYWESGMDLGMSRDWFGSFLHYQRRLRDQFRKLHDRYEFTPVNANRTIPTIHAELRERVRRVLMIHYPNHSFRDGARNGSPKNSEVESGVKDARGPQAKKAGSKKAVVKKAVVKKTAARKTGSPVRKTAGNRGGRSGR